MNTTLFQLMRNLYGHQSHSSHASAAGHSPNPHATAAAARGGFPHYPSSPTFGAMTRYGELNSLQADKLARNHNILKYSTDKVKG